ncbi:CsbD family protein [Ramlibacter sp. USB13]|uniref:CsbD family protein n=1 Tax=Ramlibacter cellulosilyticus TaxID=2764187 RepID=A0A923MVA6_9BURK|nr:CsbD family protein [Ramlibacter cellulosilyticus]MBC5785820.1 CsbD family protein [Ramlibacter cellulosilyticus]
MNQDRIQGRWRQIKGKVKEQWGKLTDDDLDVIAGRREQLLGRIQQRHGVARDEADRQVRDFEQKHPDHRLEDAHRDRQENRT